jgi:hypothetical protein
MFDLDPAPRPKLVCRHPDCTAIDCVKAEGELCAACA